MKKITKNDEQTAIIKKENYVYVRIIIKLNISP